MNFRTTVVLLALATSSLLFASCETFAGLGRDIQRAGQGIENSGEGRQW